MKNSVYHKPTSKTVLMFRPSATLIGRSDSNDPSWNKNDSIVNTVSMGFPSSGNLGPEPNITYKGYPQKGVWQKMDEINESHHSIIGVHVSKTKSNKIFEIYKEHSKLLYSL